jgi:hypothetical protein
MDSGSHDRQFKRVEARASSRLNASNYYYNGEAENVNGDRMQLSSQLSDSSSMQSLYVACVCIKFGDLCD